MIGFVKIIIEYANCALILLFSNAVEILRGCEEAQLCRILEYGIRMN